MIFFTIMIDDNDQQFQIFWKLRISYDGLISENALQNTQIKEKPHMGSIVNFPSICD